MKLQAIPLMSGVRQLYSPAQQWTCHGGQSSQHTSTVKLLRGSSCRVLLHSKTSLMGRNRKMRSSRHTTVDPLANCGLGPHLDHAAKALRLVVGFSLRWESFSPRGSLRFGRPPFCGFHVRFSVEKSLPFLLVTNGHPGLKCNWLNRSTR